MKRSALILFALLLLTFGSTAAGAQNIIVVPTATPTPTRDSDGDGLPDPIDQCPLEVGPTVTFGCPPVTPEPPGNPNPQPNPVDPNNPSGEQPPATTVTPPSFVPPVLPDGCYVTPSRDGRVNVRRAPSMDSEIIGSLSPGVIYAALGYVVNGAEAWMQILEYVGSDGVTLGYSARSVLMTTTFCPEIPRDNSTGGSAVDGFSSNPLDRPTLCYMSVGYDANYWGSSFDPALSDESSVYAAFYFEAAPGEPIPAGTPIWGVILMHGYNELPPDSPYFFQDPDHAVAAVSDQSVIDAAISGGVSAASPLAFPTPNGGVVAANGTMFYRLSDAEHVGNCGPIVAIDDLTTVRDTGEPQAIQCFTRPGTTLVESCWCESADSDCVDFLVSICYGGGAYVDAGPDMTACWFDPASSAANFDDLMSNPPTLRSVRHLINFCQDEDGVWWVDVPNPSDPFDVHGLDGGTCGSSFDQMPNTSRPIGAVRLIARLPQPGIDDLAANIAPVDCDANGVLDPFQTPTPNCQLPRDKETAAWWQQVLDMTCPAGWIMATEIDEDGEEIVTDAVCDD